MSYQIKFIEDCIVIMGLLFFISAAHFYQQEKTAGRQLTFKAVMTHTYFKLIHNVSGFLLTTSQNLASLQPQDPIIHNKNANFFPTEVSPTPHTNHTHKKEMQALNKQLNFIREMVTTDTMLQLSEKNILQELIKECETKLEHLSHFIKKSLIEHTSPDQINNQESIKLFESYITKKIIALSESVLQLTLLFYKTMTGKDYIVPQNTSTADILLTLRKINEKIKPFIS